MLRETVEKISKDFIAEAVASPNLLADMAAMEKYMAESYSGRVFVELLQNADDCKSTKIYVKEVAGNILFANNGRPFDENDVIAISRSGSSSKKRGETIGYRGVGFKSTTYLTDEIIIYSDKTYFTFSKRICADTISMPVSSIPMIRIPLLIENVDAEIECEIRKLENTGYNTVFVFRNARVQEFLEEIKQVDTGMFIFLNSIEECRIEMARYTTQISLQRRAEGHGQLVEFSTAKNNAWYIVKHNGTAIGLKYDVANKRIIACEESEQLYHSYLPSFDKMLFPFKVNADFSTDPSRKHISADEKTESAIQNIAENIALLIKTALCGESKVDLGDIFTILNTQGAFSRCNSMLKQQIKNFVLRTLSLKLRNGNTISINEYKLLPDWLDESEKNFLRMESETIGNISLSKAVYATYPNVDSFIQTYSTEQFSNDDLVAMMGETTLVASMLPEMQGKLIGRIIRTSKFEPMTQARQEKLDEIKVSTETGVKSIREIGIEKTTVAKAVQDGLSSAASKSDLSWFSEKQDIDIQTLTGAPELAPAPESEIKSVKKEIKPQIAKWRSAEQQCIEIEKFFGNTAVDVSKKNVGYDVESTTPEGEKRYIEVKSIKEDGSFSITNNEYTAAHQYGDQYYMCLLIQSAQNLQAIYIQNPLKNISFEKRIKQWEWYCDTYNGESFVFES